jgi:hypothetical protein
MENIMMNKQQIRVAAKKLNLHVTQNSNAANAAKDLFKANQRIVALEAIVDTEVLTPLWHQLVQNYYLKYQK